MWIRKRDIQQGCVISIDLDLSLTRALPAPFSTRNAATRGAALYTWEIDYDEANDDGSGARDEWEVKTGFPRGANE
mgnify:CR=1 FL=1